MLMVNCEHENGRRRVPEKCVHALSDEVSFLSISFIVTAVVGIATVTIATAVHFSLFACVSIIAIIIASLASTMHIHLQPASQTCILQITLLHSPRATVGMGMRTAIAVNAHLEYCVDLFSSLVISHTHNR